MARQAVELLGFEVTRDTEKELARMQEVNMTLRRQLERARRDALLYAAQFCEDHGAAHGPRVGWVLTSVGQDERGRHAGVAYATKLREIAG